MPPCAYRTVARGRIGKRGGKFGGYGPRRLEAELAIAPSFLHWTAGLAALRIAALGRDPVLTNDGCTPAQLDWQVSGNEFRRLLFRVVGHLPGERRRASIRHELRAGVAQASREETAATATGGCSRHRSYGDLSVVLPAAKADEEVIDRSMTLRAISACMAQGVGAEVQTSSGQIPRLQHARHEFGLPVPRMCASAMGSGDGMRWSS